MKNYAFQMSLRGRGMTHAKLAEAAGLPRSVVTKMLATPPGGKYADGNYQRERGKESRWRLVPLLTPAELIMLGWKIVPVQATGEEVRGTMFRVEHGNDLANETTNTQNHEREIRAH